jgi:excisionase family DNA binding protein
MIVIMEQTSRLLTVKETCTYLRISPPTLYRMIERRELVPVKIGKRTLFDRSDLDRFIDAAKGPPPRVKAVAVPKKPRAKRKSKALPDRLF